MNFRSLLICTSVFLGCSSLLHAQVGINTTEPRTTLEVAGDTHVKGTINVEVINEVGETDSAALLGQIGTDFVKELNVNSTGAAIAYFQEYNFTNMGGGGDWIDDLDIGIDASKYVVTVISAYYNKALEMSDVNNFAIPYVSAFVSGGTWHITADYASAAPASGTPVGQWIISTLILSRDFSKSFGVQTVNSAGTRGGAASTPIID